MENLYCIEHLEKDLEADYDMRAITSKYDNKAITVLVWRSIDEAKTWVRQQGWDNADFKIRDFSLEDFDRIDRGAKSLGVNLFIHILSCEHLEPNSPESKSS